MLDIRGSQEPEVPPQSPTAAAIARYTAPCDLIVDLGCGAGRALVEAIRADRLAIGIERNRRLAGEAREAVVQATAQGGPGFAAVVVGELDDVPMLVGRDSIGKASLMLVDMARVGILGEHARADHAEAVERFVTALGVCRALLEPGGYVFVTAPSDLLDEIKTVVGATPLVDVVRWDHRIPDQGLVPEQASVVVLRCWQRTQEKAEKRSLREIA